jgi:hypothetical protein
MGKDRGQIAGPLSALIAPRHYCASFGFWLGGRTESHRSIRIGEPL